MRLHRIAAEFARQHFGSGVAVILAPLHGGLEARGIARVLVRSRGKPLASFVAKPFTGAASRELDIYRLLKSASHHRQISPALLGWRHTGQNAGYAFLEWVTPEARWPWIDLDSSSLVLQQLALLHRGAPPLSFRAALAAWDYERELNESAQWTLDLYRHVFRMGLRPGKRPMMRALERVVTALPRLRRELLGFAGTAFIHGDAHPGNIILTRRSVNRSPVLIDWARARIGSPLEDVSSWVHSLSLWEPEAKRRHDTLLQRYLVARGSRPTISQSFRDACILAGASNALAGALRYHLTVLETSRDSARAKFNSERAAADWLRIIRRADLRFTR